MTMGFAQQNTDVLFGPDPLADGEDVSTDTESNATEMVVDTTLPLGENFEADGEAQVLQVPAHTISHFMADGEDGEMTAEEHVQDRITKFWEKNLFTFNTFQELFDFVQSHIQSEVTSLSGYKAAQEQTCTGFQNDITRVEKDIARIEGFITWMNDRVIANEAKIEEIFDGRCKTHMNFLNFMKNSQITLRLLQFLRTALENYSFVQMKQVGQILSKYAKSPKSNEEIMKIMLVELKDIQDRVHVRTEEEIGTGHIDGEREDLSLASATYTSTDLGEYKTQLLSIISQIQANVTSEVDRRQNDEVDLNQKVIEYTQNLNNEIAEIQVHLVAEADNLSAASNDLQTFIYEHETCNAQLQWMVDQLTALADYLAYLSDNFADLEAKYQSERDKYVLSATLSPNEP